MGHKNYTWGIHNCRHCNEKFTRNSRLQEFCSLSCVRRYHAALLRQQTKQEEPGAAATNDIGTQLAPEPQAPLTEIDIILQDIEKRRKQPVNFY